MKLPRAFEELQIKLREYILSGDQSVSLVLRAHLMAESILDEMIAAYLPKGNQLLERARLSFAQKLELVCSFDIVGAEMHRTLKALNTIRNKLAHRPVESVTEEDVGILLRSLGEKHHDNFRSDPDKDILSHLQYGLGVILGMLAATRETVLLNHLHHEIVLVSKDESL